MFDPQKKYQERIKNQEKFKTIGEGLINPSYKNMGSAEERARIINLYSSKEFRKAPASI